MTNTTKFSDTQKLIATEMVKMYGGETQLTRKQVIDAYGPVLTSIARREDKQADDVVRRGSPHFITRNTACKVEDSHGMYNLGVFFAKASKKKANKKVDA